MTFNKIIRPISPHLTIYKPQITSTLSIIHRITGSILSLFVLAFVFSYKFYCFFGTNYYVNSITLWITEVPYNWLVLSATFLLLFSFYYHACNGIRHLLWDIGYGFELKQLYFSGYLVVGTSFLLTVLTWIIPALIY